MIRSGCKFRRTFGVVLGASLALSACASGDPDTQRYVNADDQSLFELPNDWNVYGADDLVQLGSVPFLPNNGINPAIVSIAFDGAAGRNPDNLALATTASPYPIGAHLIRTIGQSERNFISRQVLAESAYDLLSAQGVELVNDEDFSFGRDFDGIRRLYGFNNDDGQLEGVVYMVAVTNPDSTRLYSMSIGCSLTCFNEQSDEIYKAVDSWLVNTRQ